MTDWLDRLLKQAAWTPEETPAAQSAAQALKGSLHSGAVPSGTPNGQNTFPAAALAAELLREDLRLNTPAAPAAAAGSNWLAEPASPSSGIAAVLFSPVEQVRFDARAIDRTFERDSRRYDGGFPLYQ